MDRGFSPKLFWLWMLSGGMVIVIWLMTGSVGQAKILFNSLFLALAAFAVAVAPASWIVWRIFRSCSKWERRAARLIYAMLLVPLFLQVAAWESVFGKLSWMTYLNDRVFVGIIDGWWAAIWIHGIAMVPWVVFILSAGLSRKTQSFEEQALLDADRGTVFWRVTVVRVAPLYLLALMWTVVIAFREIAVADIYQIGTYAEQVYVGFSLGQFDVNLSDSTDVIKFLGPLAQAALFGWLIVSALLVVLGLIPLRDQELSTHRENRDADQRTWLCFAITLVTLFFVVVLPMLGLVSRAGFQVAASGSGTSTTFSFGHLWETMVRAPVIYRGEIGWSVLIGFVAAILVVATTLPAAWLVVFGRRSIRFAALLLVGLCLAVPYPFIGVVLGRVCNSIPFDWFAAIYDRSVLIPAVATSIIGFGICAPIQVFALSRLSKSSLENSMTEGASGVARFWQIGVMSNWHATLVCAIVAFLVSIGDVAASFLVLPPGMDTLGRRMLGQLHSGVDDITAAAGLAAISLSIALTVAANWIWRIGNRTSK